MASTIRSISVYPEPIGGERRSGGPRKPVWTLVSGIGQRLTLYPLPRLDSRQRDFGRARFLPLSAVVASQILKNLRYISEGVVEK
jgi:hypothetical protein